jgi:hypothetical protein
MLLTLISVAPSSSPVRISAESAANFSLWSNYPSDVRNWIIRHRGLHSQIIYLGGRELTAMYPACK